MYQSVCPDIFKGGKDRALNNLDKLKLGDDVNDYMESIIALSSDYAWLMVAMAKLYNGEDLLTIIEDKWKEVLTSVGSSKDESDKVIEKHPTLVMYWKTLHLLCSTYIERSLANACKDTLYHPYGLPHFMACGVRIAYDFVSFLAKDADGEYDLLKPTEDEMFKGVIDCTTAEYEVITTLRLKLAVDMETVTPNVDYKYMFTSNMSLKEFRSMLLILINIDMLKRSGSGNLRELIHAIEEGGLLDVLAVDGRGRSGGRGRGRTSLPDDIEDMFNE
jgi:hypothetical protein